MTIDVLKALPNDTKRSLQLPNLARSRKPVRRSLFGDVDHEESMRFLRNELDSIQQDEARRWNFNFIEEKPINCTSGSYEWQPVQPTDDIHQVYALGRLPYLAANSSDVKEVRTSNDDVCSRGCEQSPEVSTRLLASETDQKTVTTKGSRQRSIMDYLRPTKRSASVPLSSTKPADTVLPDSTSDCGAEKTEESISYHPNYSAKRIRRC